MNRIAGLQAFFVTPAEISAENENASEPAPSTPQIYTSPCITTTGVADLGQALFERSFFHHTELSSRRVIIDAA